MSAALSFSGQHVCFKELSAGNSFFCKPIEECTGADAWQAEYLAKQGATHAFTVCDGSLRGCIINKTIAQVMVDEAADGSAVTEKWSIRHF